jgi:hypothetical protein
MKYFRPIESGLDVLLIAAEIAPQPDAWDQQKGRQRVRVQAETLSIPIREVR